VATVRTHLASLLAKTGTARQSDLVRLLSRLPRTTRPLADREKFDRVSFI
jgi:hypothetical protein